MHLKSLLFFLFFSITTFSQSEFQINNLKNKVVIPFKLINNLIFIPVAVNGQELTFLLDTGVEQTILFSLDESNQIKLFDVEKLKLRGLGSKEAIDSYKSSKNKIEIKDLVDSNHEIYIILDQEFNFSSHVGIPVNGIIGYKFFKKHIVEINYIQKKIIIYSHLNKSIHKKLKKRFIKEAITLEGRKPYYISKITSTEQAIPSKLLLDTGNSDALWIFENQTKKIKLPDKNIQDYLGRGFSGSVYGKRARIDNFEFGNKTFINPLVTFPDSSSVKSVNFVQDRIGSIGSEVLSRFTIVFDYVNEAIYSKQNSKINDAFNFNMSGVEVEHAGLEWVNETVEEQQNQGIKIYTNTTDERLQNKLKTLFTLKPIFKVASVRVESDAEKVGIKIGDRILKINNHYANGYNIEMINELLKSEEGKIIEMELERNSKIYNCKFQLKKII